MEGTELKQIRKQLGLTQGQLAEKLGYGMGGQVRICAMETGPDDVPTRVEASVKSLVRIQELKETVESFRKALQACGFNLVDFGRLLETLKEMSQWELEGKLQESDPRILHADGFDLTSTKAWAHIRELDWEIVVPKNSTGFCTCDRLAHELWSMLGKPDQEIHLVFEGGEIGKAGGRSIGRKVEG